MFQIRSEHRLWALDLMYYDCRPPGHTQPARFELYIYKTLLDEGYVLTRRLEFTIDEPCVPCLAIDPDRTVSHPGLYQSSYSYLTFKTPGSISLPSIADPLPLAPQGQLLEPKNLRL
jgi:hypothetical protein